MYYQTKHPGFLKMTPLSWTYTLKRKLLLQYWVIDCSAFVLVEQNHNFIIMPQFTAYGHKNSRKNLHMDRKTHNNQGQTGHWLVYWMTAP